MNEFLVRQVTSEWLEQWVMGFNLCPFAARPYEEKRVRIKVFPGENLVDLKGFILEECKRLIATTSEELETTLVVSPLVLPDFLDYWDYVSFVEEEMALAGYEGILQLATFHPNYYFGDSRPEETSNFTNRSPFPVFHLLREISVSLAIDSHPDIESVPERNIQFMTDKSYEVLLTQLKEWQQRSKK